VNERKLIISFQSPKLSNFLETVVDPFRAMEQSYPNTNGLEFFVCPQDQLEVLGSSFPIDLKQDPFGPMENRFSFSVVYQHDFPFPRIHSQSNEQELLDSQFSFGCVHGGGSMLSSSDVSLHSYLGMLMYL
jgi:hypothetical protein